MCIHNLVKFYPLVLKILSGNEFLTSIKGCNTVTNLRNLTLYNPNLDLLNCNVHTKVGKILSIGSQDIKRNEILTSMKDCIGRFQAIKTDILLIFSFITGDKTEFLSPMMFSN